MVIVRDDANSRADSESIVHGRIVGPNRKAESIGVVLGTTDLQLAIAGFSGIV